MQATVALRTELGMLKYEGARRHGSEEAPPIDWLVPPARRANAHSDAALTEICAYHAVQYRFLRSEGADGVAGVITWG